MNLRHEQLIYDKGGKKIKNGGKTASSIIFVKLDSYMKQNQIGLLSHSIYKNKLKMGYR